jgi:spermidine synthase
VRKPWTTLATTATSDGTLTLTHHEALGHVIALNGRVLMSSRANVVEMALGTLACKGLAQREGARVLIGGLGMAYTLRAMLDALPRTAHVRVAELNLAIVSWCRGPLASLTRGAVDDPRVRVDIVDVSVALSEASSKPACLDAIAIDLYVGPDGGARASDSLYGDRAVAHAFRALKPGAIFAVWGETFHAAYEQRLKRTGFSVESVRPAHGRSRAVVYVATKPQIKDSMRGSSSPSR